MAYVPEPNAATALTIALGFVNLPAMGGSPFGPISGTGCNLIGTAFTMNITGSSGTWNSGTTYASGEQVNYGGNLYQSLQDGNLGNIPNPLGGYWTQLFTLTAEDAGCVIMVMGAGAGTPGQAAPLWTTIAAVTGYNTATLTDAAINDVALAQAIVYRPLTQTFQFYNGAYVLRDSIHSESSLTTNANFSFRVHSPNGAFVPQPGQPVLAYVQEGTYVGQWSPSTTYSINQTVSVYGQQFISLASGNHNNPPAPGTSTSYWATLDIFGGKIQQAKPKNLGALSNVVQTDCECVSWQVLLTEGVLALRSTGNPTHIDSFQGNGSTTTFNLTYVPVSMVSVVERSQGTVTMSGVNATAIGSGADFAELVVGNQITIDGIPLTVASLIDLTHITVYPNPGLPTGFGYTWLGPSNTAGIVTTQTVGGVHIVTWSSGDNFEGIAIGDSIYIHGSGPFTVATKPDAYTEITVSTDPGTWTPPGVGWQGPPVTVGLEGGALTTDYYWNPATNIVTQNPNSTPLPGTRTIYVTYTYVGVSNFYSQVPEMAHPWLREHED